MKKIAIIGAGFSGLASAFHLSSLAEVTIFEGVGIGGGASGASAGLLHPYPGEQGRRSWRAEVALEATKKLLQVAEEEMKTPVANYNGILKIGECIGAENDVQRLSSNLFLIQSGITVFVDLYLEGLWRACQKRGVVLQIQKIDTLKQLEEFDGIVLATGSGISKFAECKNIPINFVKGQALLCQLEEPMERSVTARHYTAVTQFADKCYIGSTYERDFTTIEPCLERAVELLKPLHPVLEVKSGIRVTNPAHYFPLLEKINPKTYAITAMGSRGLLYHAYFAELLLQQWREACLLV